MKRIIFVLVAGVLAQTAFAAASGNATGTGSGAVMTVTAGTGNCTYLKEDVSIRLSGANIGAYDCQSDSAGVAVGSTKGKGRIYDVGSNGGALTETTFTDATSVTTGEVGTRATAAKARTSSGT